MAANIKEVQRLVDDIDNEVYYQEMLGCKVKMEAGGDCAAVECGGSVSYMCQDPNVKREMPDMACFGPECEAC